LGAAVWTPASSSEPTRSSWRAASAWYACIPT
jgi:hypothetical protein